MHWDSGLSLLPTLELLILAISIWNYSTMIGISAIAGLMFVVFSQMDKDPVLARILQSNPNKLEWSFYGKFLDTLALPLLTLLSSLLPGGAGRLIDLLCTAFSHSQ